MEVGAATKCGMISLWHHIYGQQPSVLAVCSGVRVNSDSNRLDFFRTDYFDSPGQWERARAWVKREVEMGRETFHCAHSLTARRRIKEYASPVQTLWVDGDGAKAVDGPFEPTAIVESSPGRDHLYCRLTRAVDPILAESLNRRWAATLGADLSGYDLTQLLRPPGTPNLFPLSAL